MKPVPRVVTYFVFASLITVTTVTTDVGPTSNRLRPTMGAISEVQTIRIIVSLKKTADPKLSRRTAASVGGMIQLLRDSIDTRYRELRERIGDGWTAESPELFWINQTIALTATPEMIERLARDPGIDLIEEDADVFEREQIVWSADDHSSVLVLPWNITITGVDSVWDAYGLDGSGITIGSLDTGIDTSHPALAGKLRPFFSWKDFIFSQPVPYDNLGHGTFSSGILVGGNGSGGAGPGIGIAYRSKLVVGKMLDAGSTSIAQVVAAMQWMLDPDDDPYSEDFPRVVNNSWYSGTRGSTYAYAAAETWRAAGMIPVFCAGNAGPTAGSTRSPADYKNSLSIGGTDSKDDRYSKTSVGPSPPDTTYFPADGRKPDFSAPGANVYSSQPGGGYGYSSGTSWSAPHVAGIIALMIQANPTLDYDRIHSIIRESAADPGTEGYDHVFGYGRISAMGSVTGALRSRVHVDAGDTLHTSEQGDSSFFNIVLEVSPTDTVSISLAIIDTTEGIVKPNLLYFTPSDWDDPQRIAVTGLDDSIADGDVAFSVTMNTISNDLLYNGIEPAPVNILNADDESAIGVSLLSGWNLVSIPALLDSSERPFVFPTSVSPAFAYNAGYTVEDSLRRGTGYWLKFDDAGAVHLLGDSLTTDSVAVVNGWNLVGSLSVPIGPGDIISDPPNITTSYFYGYNAGYYMTDSIRPGQGYWVKAGQSGTLFLTSGAAAPPGRTIRIVGTDELPPPPPDPMFRSEIPSTLSLGQNYPNPFNPVTRITYSLTAVTHVRLQVFNVVGQVIATLMDGVDVPGESSVVWDATGVPSGVYYYRLTTGPVTETRKMLLLR